MSYHIKYWPAVILYQCDGSADAGSDMVKHPGIDVASCSTCHVQQGWTNVSGFTVICKKNLFLLLCIPIDIGNCRKLPCLLKCDCCVLLKLLQDISVQNLFPLRASLLFLITDLIRA